MTGKTGTFKLSDKSVDMPVKSGTIGPDVVDIGNHREPDLEAIAGVDEMSVNEEIQQAIAAHIEARRSDPDFRRRLKASMDRNREILERLAR